MKLVKTKPPLIPHPELKRDYKQFLPKLNIPNNNQIKEKTNKTNNLSLIDLNKKYFNKDSITWFRHKYNTNQIIDSINDLIVTPRSSSASTKPSIPPKDNQSNKMLIKLKYLFTNDKYQKILKLKDLFLDFDFDKNKIMELEEIQTMFNVNNIKVNKTDLINLFFKDNINKKQKKKLYLNFYQFIQFCLSQDNEFRNFMKKLKEEKKKDNDFLPLNFNALLDYFIDKGEERKCLKKINRAMNSMEKAIDTDGYLIKDIKTIKRQTKEIDFDEILKEFECLFVLTKNRGELAKKTKRVRSPTKEKKKKGLPPIRECHSFENYNETVSERNKETIESIHTEIYIPKRNSEQFSFFRDQNQRCFSSKNVLFF